MSWSQCERKVGVAVHSFDGSQIDGSLSFRVCDVVVIQEQCPDWYRGYLLNSPATRGICPKSYIHIQRSQNCNGAGGTDENRSDQAIITEITETLKEWAKRLRQIFIKGNSVTDPMLYESVRNEIYQLLKWRNEFIIPYQSEENKASLRGTITNRLDWGNRMLDLDLVPRVNGLSVDGKNCSPIELYTIHSPKNPSKSGTDSRNMRKMSSVIRPHLAHHLYLKFKKLSIPDLPEKTIVYFSICSARDSTYITERLAVNLGSGGEPAEHDFSAIFLDLTTDDVNDTKDSFLVAHIYRLSGVNNGKKSFKAGPAGVHYKRPHGAAVLSIREVLSDRQMNEGCKNCSLPVHILGKREDDVSFMKVVDDLMKRKKYEDKNNGWIVIDVAMLSGEISNIQASSPSYFTKSLVLTPKIGFADVIAPDELRNDLYITLYKAEFDRGGKTAEKNVEVRVTVVNNTGEVIKDSIQGASGEPAVDEYKSAVLRHTNSPRWNEAIRVTLPPDLFNEAHVKIEFRHCSSQAPEKRLLALSYFKLVNEKEITIKDGVHDLCVYKAEPGKNKPHYMELQSETTTSDKSAATLLPPDKEMKTSNRYYSLSPRESICVMTQLCSTSLTQDADLLTFFHWRDCPQTMREGLERLRNVRSDELMRFHHDVLSFLFEMSSHEDVKKHQTLIFNALVHVLRCVKEKNFHQFRPLVDKYILETFCAPLAHIELLGQLNYVMKSRDCSKLQDAISVLDLLFQLIVQSAKQYAKEKMIEDYKFLEQYINDFWNTTIDVCQRSNNNREFMSVQMNLITMIVEIFPTLLLVFEAADLAANFGGILNNLDSPEMFNFKITCLSKLIESKLFQIEESRKTVIRLCNDHLQVCLKEKQFIRTAAAVLTDLLTHVKLYPCAHSSTVVTELFDPVCLAIQDTKATDQRVTGCLMACLITLLWMMDQELFDDIVEYNSEYDINDKSSERLCRMFDTVTDAVSSSYLPQRWIIMHMNMNSIILKFALMMTDCLTKRFLGDNFCETAWRSFFMFAVKFSIQSCLQLERFPERKKWSLMNQYGDLRLSMVDLIVNMWRQLGEDRVMFIPDQVGPFLQVALIPHNKLRLSMLPIFYDMMEVKFKVGVEDFEEMEAEMISELDRFLSAGHGDTEFRNLFQDMIMKSSGDSTSFAPEAVRLTESITSLIDKLLDYRNILYDHTDNMDLRMLAIVNLLEFYETVVMAQELYSGYVYKLVDHLTDCELYTEAAFCLNLNAHKLNWTRHILPQDASYNEQTEWQRKEKLYKDIILNLDKGQMWEKSLPFCEELSSFYQKQLFNYEGLSEILRWQASFYDKILGTERLKRNYFRIGFYGQSFPLCLRNKVYIYRSGPCERLADVMSSLKSFYPKHKLLSPFEEPTDELKQSNKQLIQVNAVDPVTSELYLGESNQDDLNSRPNSNTSSTSSQRFAAALRTPSPKIQQYYVHNDIDRFYYDQANHEGVKDKSNEFKTLWIHRYIVRTKRILPSIIHWIEVESVEAITLSPIENAINSIISKTHSIKRIINNCRTAPTQNLTQIAQTMNGTIDANVNGGIAMFKEAFLTESYLISDPTHQPHVVKLKSVIRNLMLVLRDGMELFGEMSVNTDMRPLYQVNAESFNNMQKDMRKMDSMLDITSISPEFGSQPLVTEHVDSPRVSSGYSSSDLDVSSSATRRSMLGLRKGSFRDTQRMTNYSSSSSLNNEQEDSGSPKRKESTRRQKSQLNQSNDPNRTSKFYTKNHLSDPDPVPYSTDEESDDRSATLTPGSSLHDHNNRPESTFSEEPITPLTPSGPTLPPKRNRSASSTQITAPGTISSEYDTSSNLSPMRSRPLPEPPLKPRAQSFIANSSPSTLLKQPPAPPAKPAKPTKTITAPAKPLPVTPPKPAKPGATLDQVPPLPPRTRITKQPSLTEQ